MGYTAIVDYGAGNLKSVVNAMDYLGLKVLITDKAEELELANAIILPGVGAFPTAMERLIATGLAQKVIAEAEKKPILGICLGMQFLFEESAEIMPTPGLGLIPGRVDWIQTEYKLPHIGWNGLHFQNDCPIFRGLEEGSCVYFVHSFCGYAREEKDVSARTDYGSSVVAAVHRGNVYGCQFHPEKSGEAGLQMLRNFGELNP